MEILWKEQQGQTLLEILLAFAVSVSVLGAIVLGVVTALNKAQYTKTQNLATSYAQEGMAAVRAIRDSSWRVFSDYIAGTKYCVKDGLSLNPIAAGHCTPSNIPDDNNAIGPGGIFSREAVFEHNSTDCQEGLITGSKVNVSVYWSDGECPVGLPYCHKVEQTTCFFNLDQTQAP